MTNAHWTAGGAVTNAAGRLYFEMPGNARRKTLGGLRLLRHRRHDGTSGRSVILTAAHCVYDDANKAFARNVLFIPDQAGTTGAGTDPTAATTRSAAGRRPSASSTPTGPRARSRTTSLGLRLLRRARQRSAPAAPGRCSSSSRSTGTLAVELHRSASRRLRTTTHADAHFTYALGYSYSDDPELHVLRRGHDDRRRRELVAAELRAVRRSPVARGCSRCRRRVPLFR